jgi:hypothetical protein
VGQPFLVRTLAVQVLGAATGDTVVRPTVRCGVVGEPHALAVTRLALAHHDTGCEILGPDSTPPRGHL